MQNLTDLEIEKISAFNNDTVLVEAIRKVMLASIYSNGTLRTGVEADPLKNGALALAFYTLSGAKQVSDADLGADIRGLASGINLLESGFKQLLTIKKPVAEAVETPYNEAV